MEAFAYYLLKSVIWLSGFAMVYLLFLRNERYFFLNRFYLLTGILASFFFPFISIHYTIVVPITENNGTASIGVTRIVDAGTYDFINFSFLMTILYISGVLFVAFKLFRQSRTVIKVIKKAEITALHSVKLIRAPEYTNSFSFFSYVFVNPSVTDIETREIVNHEMAHIRQRHWVDLVLVEVLCLLQWFNPVVWIYVRVIRQNHEYLADEVALQRTNNQAVYRAALLNQIVGSPVIVLANSFNYSINKKRFIMMKNKISSPYRKMKLLLILPVIAFVLYSFAKPEYKYISDENINVDVTPSSQNIKEVKGTVVSPSGKPLAGTTIMLRGTNTGVTSDTRGFFKLSNVPENGLLVVSYVGFRTRVLKPDFISEMNIKLETDTLNLNSIGVPPPPPPPPPPSMSFKIRNTDGSEAKPLFVIDGVILVDFEPGDVDPNSISNMNVLKEKAATDLYGEKGKNGVVEITTKKNDLSLVVIDGAITEIRIKDIPVIQMEKMQWLRGQDAINKYGEKGKNGAYEITTRDPETKVLNESADIKVTGYGQQKSLPAGGLNYRSQYGGKPLLVVNGFVRDIDANDISPDLIESISVKKSDPASTSIYGEKAKEGVIEITLKPGVKFEDLTIPFESKNESVKVTGYSTQEKEPVSDKDVFFVVEEMPAFPGGEKALQSYIYRHINVVKGSEKISEPVLVVFTVDIKGKVRDAQVLKKKYPVWEAEAIRVVSNMPDWKPGKQRGVPVAVMLQLPIDFSTIQK